MLMANETMSFKFNFSPPNPQSEGCGSDAFHINADPVKADLVQPVTSVEPAKEIGIKEAHVQDLEEYEAIHCVELPGGRLLGYVDADAVEKWICSHGSVYGRSTQLGSALKADSDLVPDVYEGGLKIWECSVDLVQFLVSSDIDFTGKKVLELGCGAGLPGIFAHAQGAKVHFQDYNWEVLDFITIPNILLNTVYKDKLQSALESPDSADQASDSESSEDDAEESEALPSKKQKISLENDSGKKNSDKFDKKLKWIDKSRKKLCQVKKSNPDDGPVPECDGNTSGSDDGTFIELEREVDEVRKRCSFFAGDWNLLSEMLNDRKERYDIILTSETIYSVFSYGKLLDTIETLLAPDGVVYLAAKTYYFGVGGGTRSFEEAAKKGNVFDIQQCVVFYEGLQREILQLHFKK